MLTIEYIQFISPFHVQIETEEGKLVVYELRVNLPPVIDSSDYTGDINAMNQMDMIVGEIDFKWQEMHSVINDLIADFS